MSPSIIMPREENLILLLSKKEMTFSVSPKTTGTKVSEEKWDSSATIRKCWIKDSASPRVFRKFLLRLEEKTKKFTKIQRWENKWCTRAYSQKKRVNQKDGEQMKNSERPLMRKLLRIWRVHFPATIELITNLRNHRKTSWSAWTSFDTNF